MKNVIRSLLAMACLTSSYSFACDYKEIELEVMTDSSNTLSTMLNGGCIQTLNEANIIGETVLFAAARYNAINAVDVLINNKINVNQINEYGQTALDYAYERLEQTPSHTNKKPIVEIIKMLRK